MKLTILYFIIGAISAAVSFTIAHDICNHCTGIQPFNFISLPFAFISIASLFICFKRLFKKTNLANQNKYDSKDLPNINSDGY